MRAKFTLVSIKRQIGQKQAGDKWVPCEQRSLEFTPVYGKGDPDHENTKFWQASPSGSITLNVVNLAAVENMEIGAEYYVDFTKAA